MPHPDVNRRQFVRVLYIEAYLSYMGRITRADLCEEFHIALPTATRDLGIYRRCNPSAMRYNPVDRVWERTDDFVFKLFHNRISALRYMNAFSTISEITAQLKGEFDGIQ